MKTGDANRAASPPLGRVAAYVAVGCSIAVIFWLCWVLRDVVLLAFGAIILAVMVRALARPLIARVGIHERWAITAVIVLLVAAAFGISWLFGHQVTAQLDNLRERLPRAIHDVRTWMEGSPMGRFVVEKISGLGDETGWLGHAQTFFVISVATVGHVLLMIFTGIYLAANPSLYVNGFVRLFAVRHRPKLQQALQDTGEALRKWLLGQVVSMVTVGALTGIGLWAVGAPLPLVLGIMAGLLEFIPVVGPVIATDRVVRGHRLCGGAAIGGQCDHADRSAVGGAAAAGVRPDFLGRLRPSVRLPRDLLRQPARRRGHVPGSESLRREWSECRINRAGPRSWRDFITASSNNPGIGSLTTRT